MFKYLYKDFNLSNGVVNILMQEQSSTFQILIMGLGPSSPLKIISPLQAIMKLEIVIICIIGCGVFLLYILIHNPN